MNPTEEKSNGHKILTREFYLGAFLVALLIFLKFTTKGFFALNNVMSMLNIFSYTLIASIGMNFIIITSNIDISTGALISVICITLAAVGKMGLNFWALLLVSIIAGALLSGINGVFITKLGIPAMVATLAMSQIFQGALPLCVDGSIYDLPPSFTWLGFQAKIFGVVPASVLIMLIITALALIFMRYSSFSKKLYAIGNNAKAARLAGINVNKTILVTYLIAGTLFGITATILATASQRVTTTMGSNLEMTFIAAVVLGGTSTDGGTGKVIGTVIGALILSMITSATNYLGISSDWSDAIKGAIIIASVIVSSKSVGQKKRILGTTNVAVQSGGR